MRNIIYLSIFILLFPGSNLLYAQISIPTDPTESECFDDGGSCDLHLFYYYDYDEDGFGIDEGTCFCAGEQSTKYTRRRGDCNDRNRDIKPKIWYADHDGDGYAAANASGSTRCHNTSSQKYTDASGNHWSVSRTDCDDTNGSVVTSTLWYADTDGDGAGDPNSSISHCGQPSGYVSNRNDCDDTDGSVQLFIWYRDDDNDALGDPNDTQQQCAPPTGNWVRNGNDECPHHTGDVAYKGCPPGDTFEDRNTILSTTYDISGRVTSKSKAYFNDMGKLTQTQTLDVKTGKIWANHTFYDARGRPALQTLSAPVRDYEVYLYKEHMVRKTNGSPYLSADFETDPENPAAVGNQINTLGRYYSTSNAEEPYQDITQYPFSRTVYSKLSPGTVKAVVGGNKTDTNNDGTINDSDTWLQTYSFTMPAGEELSTSAAFGSTAYNDDRIFKTVSRDVHGVETVVFADSDGNTLAAARSGNESGTNNASETNKVAIGRQGWVDIHVPQGVSRVITLTSSHSYGGFSLGSVDREVVSGTLAAAQPRGFYFRIYDLIDENKVTEVVPGSYTLPNNGFYRIELRWGYFRNMNGVSRDRHYSFSVSGNPEVFDMDNETYTVSHRQNYYDYSLNYYDKAGRLLKSTQPLDKQLASTFKYNTLGQLLETTSPDEGTAKFKYRKDGQIRFSQNTKQAAANEFSYTNYDELGRPEESGVAVGAFSSLNPDNLAFTSTAKREQQFTTYDYPESADLTFLAGVGSDYSRPTFLASNVVRTKNDNTTTYYSYDIYGRVQWLVQNITGLGVKTIDYEYDPVTSQVNRVIFQKGKTDQFIHRYTYDAVDYSLVKVETSTDNSTYTTHAEYEYYETGALKRLLLAPVGREPLQAIDYVYNLNGQLKAINADNDADDLFAMQLDYHSGDYSRSVSGISSPGYGQDQYNGNIKGARWKNKGIDNSEQTYSYYYDKNNWLTHAIYGQYADTGGGSVVNIFDEEEYMGVDKAFEASHSVNWLPGFEADPGADDEVTADIVTGSLSTFQSGDYNVFDVTYDANGNIQSLHRNKQTEGGDNRMDQLHYTYKEDKPNQLLRVEDAVGDVGVGDIGDQEVDNYAYNSIGQLVENKSEGIGYTYNASGLVTEITKDDQPLVKFFYDDKGHRVKKEAYTDGVLSKTEYYVRDAAGTAMAIYNGTTPTEYTIYGASRLGVYNALTGANYYQLTDHLGNVRMVITPTPSVLNFTLNYESNTTDTDDEDFFEEVENIVTADVHDYPHPDETVSHDKTQQLTGAAGSIIGSVLTIPVVQGDKVSAEVYAKYLSAGSSNPTAAVGSLLINALTGNVGGSGYEGAITSSYGTSGSMVTNVFGGEVSSTEPKAFLNLLFLPSNIGTSIANDHFTFAQLTDASDNAQARLALAEPFEAPETGYVVVYLSNESPQRTEVYFDDLNVTVEYAVTDKTDYYPFGMPMPGRTLSGTEGYRYAYQGQEKDPETGKEAFQLRLWDSRIGRWLTTDPYGEFFSPYLGMGNNPASTIDPDGGCTDCPKNAKQGDIFNHPKFGEMQYDEFLGWNIGGFSMLNTVELFASPRREEVYVMDDSPVGSSGLLSTIFNSLTGNSGSTGYGNGNDYQMWRKGDGEVYGTWDFNEMIYPSNPSKIVRNLPKWIDAFDNGMKAGEQFNDVIIEPLSKLIREDHFIDNGKVSQTIIIKNYKYNLRPHFKAEIIMETLHFEGTLREVQRKIDSAYKLQQRRDLDHPAWLKHLNELKDKL